MSQPRIVEVDYYEFARQLKTAGAEGRIERTDRQRWSEYVRQNKVLEASCLYYARKRAEDAEPVILSSGGSWDGFYVFSRIERFCLKFQPPAGTAEPSVAAPPAAPQAEAPAADTGAPEAGAPVQTDGAGPDPSAS
jgi:hypothetical protein